MTSVERDSWLSAGIVLNSNGVYHLAETTLALGLQQLQKVASESTVSHRSEIDAKAVDQLIFSFQNQSKLNQALAAAKAMNRSFPSAYSAYRLGEIYYLLREDHQALEHFRRALISQDFNEAILFEIYKNMGNIFVREGDFDSAQEYFDKAYTLDPRHPVLLVNYGTLEIVRDNLDAAKQRFLEALGCESKCDKAWVGLALLHQRLGDYELMLGALDTALDAAPGNETAVKLFVEAAVARGQMDRALARVEAFLAMEPANVDVILTHAQLLWCKSRLPEASLQIEQALLWDPTSVAAQKLARVMEQYA